MYKRPFDKFIIASICLLGVVLGAKLDTTVSAMFRDEPIPTRYFDRVEYLSSFPPQGSIAFYGDSHVERGLWREMTGLDIANFGVGNDRVDRLRKRMDSSQASRIILLIGVNDVKAGYSPRVVADGILRLVSEFDNDFLLIEIMPVRDKYGVHNASIEATNRYLESGCKARCTFIRTWPALSEDGELRPYFSRDGLHLNADGYAVLSDIVRNAVLNE